MKKTRLFIMLVAALLVITLGALAAFAQTEDVQCYEHGDVNGDGSVDNRDAVYTLYNWFFGNEAYPVNQNCDFTKDGIVTNQDAVYLLYASFDMFEEYKLDGVIHSYYEPVWSWSSSGSTVSATATFRCGCGQTQTFAAADGVQITAGATKESTCTATGTAEYTAKLEYNGSTYTDSYIQEIPASGNHSFRGTQSCESSATCSSCGFVAEAKGHNWKLDPSASTAATCSKNAVEVYKCETCKQSKSVTVSGKLEHSYQYVENGDKKIDSCTYVKQYKCVHCGTTVSGTAASDTHTKHTYTATLTKEATCSQTGVKTFACQLCDHSYTETVAKNDAHKWVKGATQNGTTTYSCSSCKETKSVISATGDSVTAGKSDLQKTDQLELGNGTTIALDDATVNQLDSSKNIVVSVTTVNINETGLSAAQKQQVGNNTVYDFNMTYSNGTKVSEFAGEVTISLPYTLNSGDDVDAIEVWYINDQGKAEMVNGVYSNGFVTFTTDHFSYYTVTRLTPAERCQKHGHIEFRTVKAAGCTTDGYDMTICQRCGSTINKVVTPMTGHTMQDTANAKAATCDKAGVSEQKCKTCSTVVTKELVALGHNMQKDTKRSKDATCTATGLLVEVCANANCSHETIAELAQLDHDYGPVEEKDADCGSSGHKQKTCKLCGKKEIYDQKPITGHNYLPENAVWQWSDDLLKAEVTLVCASDKNHTKKLSAVVTIEQSGGCQDGKIIYTATASFNKGLFTDTKEEVLEAVAHQPGTELQKDDPAQHYYICKVCGQAVNAADHKWNSGTTTKAATCGTAGVKSYKCTVCGATKDEAIPATGKHNFSGGICKTCGQSEGPCTHELRNCTVVSLNSLIPCGGQYYTFTCDCGEYSVDCFDTINCDLGKESYSSEKLDDGTIVEVVSRTCNLCGTVVQNRSWEEQLDSCRYIYHHSCTMLKDGKTLWQGMLFGPEEETSHSWDYESAESVLLDQYGLCGYEIWKCVCKCGEKTLTNGYEYMCWFELDEAKSTDTKQVYSCSGCGAIKTREITVQAASAPCTMNVHYVETFSLNSSVVYSVAYDEVQESHSLETMVQSHRLYGDTCADGVYTYSRCTVCGKEENVYRESCRSFYWEEKDLSASGTCYDKWIQWTCPCGQYKELDIDGELCTYGTPKVTTSGTTTTTTATCTVCSGTLKVVETKTIGANCQVTTRLECTLKKKNGTTVATGTDLSTYTNHNTQTRYELLGSSCEDGVKVIDECENCDYKNSYTEYYHYPDIAKNYDISSLGACSSTITVYSCLCGAETYCDFSRDDDNICDMHYEDDGTERCATCGLTRTYAEEIKQGTAVCEQIVEATATFSRENKTPVTVSWSSKNFVHNYLYELQLTPGGTTCSDGYSYTATCQVCGTREYREGFFSDHAGYPVARQLYKDDTLCGPITVTTYSCACGDNTSTRLETTCSNWDWYDEVCLDCGCYYTYDVVVEQDQDNSCKTNYISTYEYYTAANEKVASFTEYDSDYNCEFKIVDADLDVDDCTNGTWFNVECIKCGRVTETYSYAHRQFITERTLWDSCNNNYFKLTSCACGEEKGVYYGTDGTTEKNWSYTDESGNVHDCVQYACASCGKAVLEDRKATLITGETCKYLVDAKVMVLSGETVIKEAVYQTIEQQHKWQWQYELAEGAQSCEDGINATYICQKCGLLGGEHTLYYHDETLLDSIDLAQYGSKCGAVLEKYGCVCGAKVRYALGEDTACDFDQEYEEIFLEGVLNGHQYTSDGSQWFDSYIWTYTCAVTAPDSCGVKLRMAEYWLAEDNCMAAQYQLWQLGYDPVTDTCQREIKIATGNRAVYHDYITESFDNGQGVYGWKYTCADCGSTCTETYTQLTETERINEIHAVNTLYTENGKNREWYIKNHWKQFENAYTELQIESYYKKTYADGSVYWHKETYTYSNTEDGCFCTTEYTNSNGVNNTSTSDHAGTIYYEHFWDPTCTQEALEIARCGYCGEITDVDVYANPTDHTFRYDSLKNLYVCTDCGLESVSGASGAIAMEDLSTDTQYRIGYWNQQSIPYTVSISVVLEDAQGDDNELVLTGIDVLSLTREQDGVRAMAFSKEAAHEAARQAMANVGYSGSFAIRFCFVPTSAAGQLDYAITFDSVTAQ